MGIRASSSHRCILPKRSSGLRRLLHPVSATCNLDSLITWSTHSLMPYMLTIFDKECPKCHIVLRTTFSSPARQTFLGGLAEAHVTGLTLDIGALSNNSKVLPMVSLSVNASAGVAFSLKEASSKWGVKASLSLGDFQQNLLVSHIGKIDMSDLTRDIKSLLNELFANLNQLLPTLPPPSFGKAKLAKPVFTIG